MARRYAYPMTDAVEHDSAGVMLGGVYREQSATQQEAAAAGDPLIGPALADLPPGC